MTVAIVGGGPAGLSAALFTAKNGLDTLVFDTDTTWLHSAYLLNYLGIEGIDGDEFLEVARRQANTYGADRHQREEVTDIEPADEGFIVKTDRDEYDVKYVVLATGQSRDLAGSLGCEFNENGTVRVDENNETTIENVYAAGWIARKDKIQVAISVGMGSSAGLDILSKERGRSFRDFDTAENAE
ncbi:NAD(P)/FAD-dependent oxidoreductase [Natrinema gelatinilyticum]|uniref:NAD(P)/FAD-dependent oxidoreductase n=1 Tax=Natrinema gelatinilyticum TaxID=2961571 RepID=UPI0020C5384F|nr:FAD-dependent oxidoreductase [Natrinema gelatinilyticum]